MRIALVLAALAVCVVLAGDPTSLFAPSHLETASGKRADPDSFFEAADCGECHVAQFEDWKGSLHSRAHHDSLYLAFAHRAREEGGEELYRFCSSCHAPLAVATGEIPGGKATYLTDEGVTCDACHHVKEIREHHAGGGANASIVLEEGGARYGPLRDAADNPVHGSAFSELHTKAELCSACHTLIHPHNGLVIENTFEEWTKGPYAKAGIVCQDCHMRTAEEARIVAKTMKPVKVPGKASVDSEERPDVSRHLFTGGNSNAQLTGSSERHAAEARARLQSAAELALELPEAVTPGELVNFTVAVTNVGAGHAIPTSITELRQMWLDVTVTDATGAVIHKSGALDGAGKVDPSAVMYHVVLVDEDGQVTYLPWRGVRKVKENLIAPKETKREVYALRVPKRVEGPLRVKVVMRYRSAPQDVMDELFGKGKYPIEIVDMADEDGAIRVR